MLHKRTAREWTLIGLIWLMVLTWAMLAGGCGPRNLPPGEELTPLEKAKTTATWINDTYTAQWDDYQAMVTRTDLTDPQKEILRTKYKILQEVDPLRKQFNQLISEGLVPSRDLEMEIMGLLNRLQSMASQPEGG